MPLVEEVGVVCVAKEGGWNEQVDDLESVQTQDEGEEDEEVEEAHLVESF